LSKKKARSTVISSDPQGENPVPFTGNKRELRTLWQSDWLFWLFLAAVTMLAYHPAWNGQQLWDDDQHMIRPELYPVSGLVRIWTEPRAIRQYYPVLGTIFWIENKIWGIAPLPHHLVNILTHSLVALLVLCILRRLEIPGERLAAILFALHPVQVESVAWNTELKNTVSGLFCLGATLTYLRFDQKRRWKDYAFALGLFACALLSKTVVATLPAALLVVLWWKRGKLSWKKDVLPLIPFFVLSAGLGAVSIWMEQNVVGAEGSDFQYSIIERCLIAGRAIWFYLGKLIWPHPLIFIYPRWEISQLVWWQYLFPVAALALLIALWRLREKSRGPLAALLLFAGTLFPALGFFNVYPFRFSFVADHFQYLACIGPLALAAAGISSVICGMKQSAGPFLRPLTGVVLGGLLAAMTWQQSRVYSDIETLWHATIAQNPECWIAYGHLGWTLFTKGDVDSSIPYLERALKIKPNDPDVHDSLGLALKQKGQLDAATAHFEETLKLRPNDSVAFINLGAILEQKGQVDAAVVNYRKALLLKPDDAEIHARLGGALRQLGVLDQAMAHLQLALDMKFDDARVHRELGLALHQKGRISEAIPQYQRALVIKPDYAEAHNDLGVALFQIGQAAEAIVQFKKTLALIPDNVETLDNLAWLLATASPASLRNGTESVEFAERAAKLTGGKDPSILNTQSAAYAAAGRFEEALATAHQALKLAEARFDSALVGTLQKEIRFYEMRQGLP
jgi:Flp pilus assembly protein TadD